MDNEGRRAHLIQYLQSLIVRVSRADVIHDFTVRENRPVTMEATEVGQPLRRKVTGDTNFDIQISLYSKPE